MDIGGLQTGFFGELHKRYLDQVPQGNGKLNKSSLAIYLLLCHRFSLTWIKKGFFATVIHLQQRPFSPDACFAVGVTCIDIHRKCKRPATLYINSLPFLPPRDGIEWEKKGKEEEVQQRQATGARQNNFLHKSSKDVAIAVFTTTTPYYG